MSSIADVSVTIQTSSRSVPATPSWFGESHPTRYPTFPRDAQREVSCFLSSRVIHPMVSGSQMTDRLAKEAERVCKVSI